VKRLLLVEVDAEESLCGACSFRARDSAWDVTFFYCDAFTRKLATIDGAPIRNTECLAAEAAAKGAKR
jgi:hypothetical protein